MPLINRSSKSARKENIKREIAAGKDPLQAVAIGYSVQREAKRHGHSAGGSISTEGNRNVKHSKHGEHHHYHGHHAEHGHKHAAHGHKPMHEMDGHDQHGHDHHHAVHGHAEGGFVNYKTAHSDERMVEGAKDD